jgi:ABC-2 type transport system ATP-binding protein
MLGLRTQTSGEVRVLGGTPAAAVAAGKIGGMLQTSGLPDSATVGELGARNRAEAVQIGERQGWL